MNNEYVEERSGGYYVRGIRITLDSLVYAFKNGQTAESIAQSFPFLTLEQVYGAIAFYLANRSLIDEYLEKDEIEFERMRRESRKNDPMFYQKLVM